MTQQFTIQAVFNNRGAVRNIRVTRREMDRLAGAAKRTGNFMAGLGAAAVVGLAKGFADAADTTQNFRNRLNALGGDSAATEASLVRLKQVADQTRTSFQATGELFTRLSLSTKELGVDTAGLVQFTKSLNQAVSLSGATAQEAEAAIIQLSQGMASGTLRGDELRSVLEQLPKVGDVIARGLNTTRGELKRLGEEGKISAKAILGAFQALGPEIQQQFDQMTPTISQSMTVVGNAVVNFADGLNTALGVSEGFGRSMQVLSGWINEAAENFNGFKDVLALPEEERNLAKVGEQINMINRELRRYRAQLEENPENAGLKEMIKNREKQLDLLKGISKEKTKTAEIEEDLSLEDAAERAKREALFQQVYAKALADARGPQQKFNEQQKALNQLLVEGKIEQGEYNALLSRYSETLDRLKRNFQDPIQKRVDGLKKENALRKIATQQGSVEADVQRARVTLEREMSRIKGEDVKLTETQLGQLREEIRMRAILDEGALGTVGQRLQDLRDETDILRMKASVGEDEANVLETRIQLERELAAIYGKDDPRAQLTQDQINAIREEIQLQKQLSKDISDTEQAERTANDALKERVELEARVTTELARRADGMGALKDKLNEFRLAADDTRAAVNSIADSFANNLSNGLSKALFEGKGNFKDFAQSLISDIGKVIVQLLVMRAVAAIGNSFGLGGGAGGASSALLSSFSGARADGGAVNKNKSYLVGENGPEMFTPGENGKVTKNSDLAGSNQQAPAPVTNLQVVNVQDPAMIPQAIADGNADDAIVNVLSRNADAIRNIIQ